MFRQLIEGIRNRLGEGSVLTYDKTARQSDRYGKRNAKRQSSGSAYVKQAANKMSRRDARQKLRIGEPDEIRKSVRKGYLS